MKTKLSLVLLCYTDLWYVLITDNISYISLGELKLLCKTLPMVVVCTNF